MDLDYHIEKFEIGALGRDVRLKQVGEKPAVPPPVSFDIPAEAPAFPSLGDVVGDWNGK